MVEEAREIKPPAKVEVADDNLVLVAERPFAMPSSMSPLTVSLLDGVVVPMPTKPASSTNKALLPAVRSPVKVDEELTMMPTVEVGLMALAVAKLQFSGLMSEESCQVA